MTTETAAAPATLALPQPAPSALPATLALPVSPAMPEPLQPSVKAQWMSALAVLCGLAAGALIVVGVSLPW